MSTQSVTITKLETLSGIEGISTGHWARGVLNRPLEVGGVISMLREANSIHPDGCVGLFLSSPIVKIEGDKIYTQNSIYRLS